MLDFRSIRKLSLGLALDRLKKWFVCSALDRQQTGRYVRLQIDKNLQLCLALDR